VSEAYRRAGVDLDANARAVELIKGIASGAATPEVAETVGGFAGLYRLGDGRLLAAGTDGVGTKTAIAGLAGRYGTIGIDLVAMSVDDVVCTGARPLFFLDTIVVGRLVPERVAEIVSGVAEGCRRAGCALLGGETAEHPDLMEPDAFDLVGFCVGIVEEEHTLGPHRVRDGDVLIGLPSSGLHANGFSLVRKALLDRYDLGEVPAGLSRPLADELLTPCEIYAPTVLTLADDGFVHAAAHVTGGGIPENVPRMLPGGVHADIDWEAWDVPPIFEVVREAAGATDDDMRATFNLGIGMVLAVAPDDADIVRSRSQGARVIGRVVPTG
jgi:phosphoribosylformylglycinamidine cyclo-ligase